MATDLERHACTWPTRGFSVDCDTGESAWVALLAGLVASAACMCAIGMISCLFAFGRFAYRCCRRGRTKVQSEDPQDDRFTEKNGKDIPVEDVLGGEEEESSSDERVRAELSRPNCECCRKVASVLSQKAASQASHQSSPATAPGAAAVGMD